MAFHTIEAKVFGFKAEAARGVSEAAPDKFLATGADANLDANHVPIEDNKIRGSKLRFESQPGVKGVIGSVPDVHVEAMTIGPLLKGVLGSVVSTQPDNIGAPTVWQHVVTRSDNPQLPSSTFFMDRGLGKKRYPLGIWKKLSFAGPTEGPVTVSADVLAQKEEVAPTIAPSFDSPKPFLFHQTDFKVNGVADLDVRSWALDIDNNASFLRTFNQSQDPRDIVSRGKFNIEGSFEVYFTTEANRAAFLANTAAALQIVLTGATITGAHKFKLTLDIPGARYLEYPYANLDELLGAEVKFRAERDAVAGYELQATLVNTLAAI